MWGFFYDLWCMSKVTVPGSRKVVELEINQELIFARVDKDTEATSVSLNGRHLGYVQWGEVQQLEESIKALAVDFAGKVKAVIEKNDGNL